MTDWRPGSDPGTPRQRRQWLAAAETHVRSQHWDALDDDQKWQLVTAFEYAETDDHCRVLRDMLQNFTDAGA